ncbi:MAG: B12-binding domain-containing radical SAM protein [Elusimicrobia bacterium]|nr:B12-binding domain-containing radical SAM protein [Elusimicrobiota bacterium]
MGLKAALATIGVDEHFVIQLSLQYLKTYFQKHSPLASRVDIEVHVFPPHAKARSVAEALSMGDPDLVGFSCYVWNVERILKAAGILRGIKPGCKIVLGGPEVSPRAEEILTRAGAVDIVARGEGERTFTELVELCAGQGELSKVKGIAYRSAGRAVRVNPDRTLLMALGKIPSPYLQGTIEVGKDDIVPLETMRGCPFRCSYCYYHKDSRKLRRFPLSRIEEEFKLILSREPTEVYLMDPTFNADAGRAKAVLRLFRKHNRGSRLHCELRAELLDREMVELLHRANAQFLEIGIQSANPETLRLVNRGLDRTAFERGIALLNEKAVSHEIQLIDSLPGDAYSDLKRSLDWVHRLAPPHIEIMPLAVLPGTDLRRDAKRFGLEFDPRPPYHSRGSDRFPRDDLRRVHGLRKALSLLHNAGFFRRGIRMAAELLGVGFSDILEAWGGRGSSRRADAFPLRDLAKIPGFLMSLCRRHGMLRKSDGLRRVLQEDMAEVLMSAHLQRVRSGRPAGSRREHAGGTQCRPGGPAA